MWLQRLFTISLLFAGSFSTAIPDGDLSISPVGALECLAVQLVVNVLHALPTATPFCSSYLCIKTVTYITGVTTTLPTVTALSTAYTTTRTITPAVVTSQTIVVSTATVCSKALPVRAAAQGAAVPVPVLPIVPFPVVPAQLKPFLGSQLSKACSCLSIPTPHTTRTITATRMPTFTSQVGVTTYVTETASTTIVTSLSTQYVTSCPTPTPTTCANQGVQYAAYNNIDPTNYDPPAYSTFDPAFMKDTSELIYSSVTSDTGLYNYCKDSQISVYGNAQLVPCNFLALNHRAYLHAPTTGTYTFTISQVDDIALLWLGPLAYSGWTRANANLVVGYPNTNSVSIPLTQGDYLPFRLIYANAQEAASFQFSITGPDNTVLTDYTTSTPSSIVQYSCDKVIAPPFADFGHES